MKKEQKLQERERKRIISGKGETIVEGNLVKRNVNKIFIDDKPLH